MSVPKGLLEAVGTENFSDSPEVLETYAGDFSLAPRGVPNYVVRPETAEQIQKIIGLANDELIPVVPVSSGVHFNGAAIPKQGGIIIDLSRMNKILEIDELNRRVRIESGVTWEQLTGELENKGLRIMMPLLPHPQRSVVTDHLEREVITNTVYDYGEPLQSLEVVWPNGDIFRTGSASVTGYPDSPSKGANPSGPGIDFYRFIQGAQGTMGIVTWANLKIEYQPQMDKILLAPVNKLDSIIEYLYRILRLRISQECLLLNGINLAAIVAQEWPEDFDKLRKSLPPWTLVLVVSGLRVRPEEKIEYEEDVLRDISKNEFPEIMLTDSLPGFPGLGRRLLPMLRKPWPKDITYWKNRYRGGCQSLFFIARPGMATKYIKKMNEVAVRYGYPINDIGGYIQPIEHNRACHLEFNLFYDLADDAETERVSGLYDEAAQALLKEGALFTRPYDRLAGLVYEKATGYATTMKKVKKIFDPNNIMNPGNLCF